MKHTRKANKKKITRRKKNLVKKHTRKHKRSYRRKVQRGGDPFDDLLTELTLIAEEIETTMKFIEEQNSSIKEIDEQLKDDTLTKMVIADTNAINLIKKDIEKNYTITIFEELQKEIDAYAAKNAEFIKRVKSKKTDEKFTEDNKNKLIEQAKNRANDPSKVMDRLEEELRKKLAKIDEFQSRKKRRIAELSAKSEKKNKFYQEKKRLETEINTKKQQFLDIFKTNILLLGTVLFESNPDDPNDDEKYFLLNSVLLKNFKDDYEEIYKTLKNSYKYTKKETDYATAQTLAMERPSLATTAEEKEEAAEEQEEAAEEPYPIVETETELEPVVEQPRWRRRRKKTKLILPLNIEQVLQQTSNPSNVEADGSIGILFSQPDSAYQLEPEQSLPANEEGIAPPLPPEGIAPPLPPNEEDQLQSVPNPPYNLDEPEAIEPATFEASQQLWQNDYFYNMPLIFEELKDINLSLLEIFFTKSFITEESLQYFNFARDRIIYLINALNNNIFNDCWQGWDQKLGSKQIIDQFFDLFIINFIHSYRDNYPYRIRPGILNNLIYRILYLVFLIQNPINNNIQAGISYWMRFVFNSHVYPTQILADTDLSIFDYNTGRYYHPYR
jgi:hypothetical protein